MYKLPPNLEKFLAALGINTERLNWKISYWLQDWERFKKRFTQKAAQKYKYCVCGELALAEYTECPRCGRKLDAYAAYKIKAAARETAAEYNLVSIGLIAVCGILFALQIAAQGPPGLMQPDGLVLLQFGALYHPLVFQEHEYWRVLTAGLCHIGLLHILFNSVAIWQTLPHFETEVGAWRTLLMLTLTELGAFGLDLAYASFSGDAYVTAGASGMACGIIGFGSGYFQRTGRIGERNFFLKWFAFCMIAGFFLRFNNLAHLGGFLSGLPLGYWMAGRAPAKTLRVVLSYAGMLCLLLWIAALTMMFVRMLNQG